MGKIHLLPAGYHRVCGPGGQCCHHLLVLEEEEHLPPADDDAGGVRLGLHHQQRLHIQPPQNIQEVRVCMQTIALLHISGIKDVFLAKANKFYVIDRRQKYIDVI